MVTSGGMLLEKLDCDDPQLLKQEPFDGVRSYAQNKRQMVSSMALCTLTMQG